MPEKSYAEAFAVLQHNAQMLEKLDQVDLDQLVPIVEESMAAYKVCKRRIDSIQKALDQTFAEDAENF